MTAQEIERWIVSYLARVLALPEGEIAVDAPFDRLGVDSVTAVALIGDLEDGLGYELDPSIAVDHPTIAGLARYLAAQPIQAS